VYWCNIAENRASRCRQSALSGLRDPKFPALSAFSVQSREPS
jgi:hypothetical protein